MGLAARQALGRSSWFGIAYEKNQLSGFQGIKFPWKPTLSGSIEYHGPPRSGHLFLSVVLVGSLNSRQLGLPLWAGWIVLPFQRAAGARSQRLSWNRAWGRGSPGARGEGGQRTGSAPGAGRSRAAGVGNWVLAGMRGLGVGYFPIFLS